MTSCHPSRHASFPSLGDTTRSARVSPARGRTLPHASLLELVTRYLLPECCRWKRQDLLRSWGTPIVLLPCSSTPVGPTHQAMQCVGAAPDLSNTKAPAFVLSRLNHTASALAVYASQAGSPRHHARLASGCWPSSSGRAWLPAGFHRKVSPCILHAFLLSQVQRSARTPRRKCSPGWLKRAARGDVQASRWSA
jgi:hypothetical protein